MHCGACQTKLIHFGALAVHGTWQVQAAGRAGLGGELAQGGTTNKMVPTAAQEASKMSDQAADGRLEACVGADRWLSERTLRRRFAGTVFAMVGLMLWTSAAPALLSAATAVAVSGSCTAHGHALKRGDAVQVGDTVDVPAHSELKLRMADGSVVSVAPGSSMTVANYDFGNAGRHAKLALTRGMLRAVVAAVGGPSTFEVSTAVGSASVHSPSADWFIETQPGWARVGVIDGAIDLTSAATGRSVAIPVHWGGRQEAGLDPVPPRPWLQAEFNEAKGRTE